LNTDEQRVYPEQYFFGSTENERETVMHQPLYFTPVVTALKADGSIDKEANLQIWDRLVNNSMSGIVIMGSTGEFFALEAGQKKELISLAAEHLKGRTKLFVGTGNMRVNDTIELSNFAVESGADGVMVVGPYYFGLTDESIELYFSEVAKNVKGDIFLYNFPDRTGYDLKPNIALSLLKKFGNVIGYKDTVGNWNHTRELIITVRDGGSDDFIIMTGSDAQFLFTLLSGGNGSIGATSNLYPELSGAWIKSVQANDLEKALAIQKVMERINLASAGAFFIPAIKKAMMLRGVDMQDYCTFPIARCTAGQTEILRAVLDELEPKVKAVL